MPGFKNWASGEILSAADLMKLPQHNHVIKPSDESVTSSVTQQDDDHLLLAVSANTDYILEGGLVYSATNGADMAFGWTAPSGATMWWNGGTAYPYDAGGTPYMGLNAVPITSIVSALGFSSGGLSNPFRQFARPYGLLRVAGTSGNIRLRWAQQTSHADATVMRTGSWIRITKIS